MNDRPPFPRIADATMLARNMERLGVKSSRGDEPAARLHETLRGEERAAALLHGIMSASPFLSDCVIKRPQAVLDYLAHGPDAVLAASRGEIDGLDIGDRSRLMAGMRQQRLTVALTIALADLDGRWRLDEITAALSDFADLCLVQAVRHLLEDGRKRNEIDPEGVDGSGSGVVVLAMGKLGARELNYSSDIDLIVLFDDTQLSYRGPEAPMAFTVRLARFLQHVIEHKTADGYVFRTDLRLRPHLPGHPLAISTDAALTYYERHGQNWERAAFIKARAVAGDLKCGQRFLRAMQPFVWRKHLDYAAIRDIQSIKRQINAHRGFSEIRVMGHDLKVGRGGIREIEFFAQTQQLILGGRAPELREPGTEAALSALSGARWIEAETAEDLQHCYRSLRTLEHRLQMIADKQTQIVPAREDEFEQLAAFAGFSDGEASRAHLLDTLRTVERHYAQLFEAEPDLGGGDTLVFTGASDHPATLATLASYGFSEPARVSQRIRAWHHGHIRATRSERARELLTELTPTMLEALRRQSDVDNAFKLLDKLISGLPTGVQIFSLLRANPKLFHLIFDLIGAAPALADHLAGNVDLFDAMLQPDFFDPLPDEQALEAELRIALKDARDLQDHLDICRRWAHGRQFQAGLNVLLGLRPAREVFATYTHIAELTLRDLLPQARAWLNEQHGDVPRGQFVIVALGRLGSRELTTSSDLDLIFIYDAADDARSDGAQPLPAHTYFARLGQRLVSAISARTAEGRLFEIDTRLRPSGNVGPIACSLQNFIAYHERTAAIWEHQALTRARAVAGEHELAQKVDAQIDDIIARERDRGVLAREVRAMRLRMFKEHGSDDPWAVKHARGGLVELEFIAQFLQLAFVRERAELRHPTTAIVLERAGDLGILEQSSMRELLDALSLQQTLLAIARLSLLQKLDPSRMSDASAAAVLRAAARAMADRPPATSIDELRQRLVESQRAVCQIFDRLCPPEDEAG